VPVRAPGGKDPLRLAFLRFLHRRYQITEGDLQSAELALVPEGGPRDVGLGRSLVAAYGQDDRLCSFAALRALIDLSGTPERTSAAYLTDREEVGSTGATGAQSEFLSLALQRLLRGTGALHHENVVRAAWARTEVLSADVGSGVNPLFPEAHDLGNAARLGHGPMLRKYTGRRGKEGHDAHAEVVARIARIFEGAGVPWQVGTAGRVDEGGGGTIAGFLARLGAEVLDIGVPVLSLHAPYEVSSKRDLTLLHRALGAFFRAP
jgi:aspartyl aminopeptidase